MGDIPVNTAKHIFTVSIIDGTKPGSLHHQTSLPYLLASWHGNTAKGGQNAVELKWFQLYLKERQKVYWCQETQKQQATGKFCVSFWATFLYALHCLKVGVTRGKNLVSWGSCNFRAHNWAIFTTSWRARSSQTFRKFNLGRFFLQIQMPVTTLVYDIAKGLWAKFQVLKSKTA